MAYKKKTDTTASVASVKTAKIDEQPNVVVDEEKEKLKEQVAELSNQLSEMAELKAQIALMAQMLANKNEVTQPTKEDTKNERYITFVNMTRGGFTIRGTSMYRISEQFGTRDFLEHEAQVIVNNMGNAIRNGQLYIADAEFVAKNQLKDVYADLLSNETLKNLLNKDSSYVVEVFKSVSKGQQDIIVDMIENKKLNGQKVDANILVEIGELTGRDLISMQPLEDDKEG